MPFVVPVPNEQSMGQDCTSRNPMIDVPRWKMLHGQGRRSYAEVHGTALRFPQSETFWFQETVLHYSELQWE